MIVLEDALYLGDYVTPKEAKHKPIYNWFIYPHSFSPTLVWNLIDRFGLVEGDRIFDPFVGAGTTVLAAKEKNISAIGLDLLPVSAALTGAKIANYDIPQLKKNIDKLQRKLKEKNFKSEKLAKNILEMRDAPKSIIAKAFDEATLNQIVHIKSAIIDTATSEAHYHFFLTALLVLLEDFSFTLKAGGWLKMLEQPRNTKQIIPTYIAQLNKMLAELCAFQCKEYSGEWGIQIGDARDTHSAIGSVKAIISSPPYLNRHDYTRVLCLELLIGFLDYYDEIAYLRHNLLRSHVEAKPVLYPLGYKIPERVTTILEELTYRKAENRVLRIVEGYFEDMYAVLRASASYLVKGGHTAFVLGNVRFSGLPIPVDEIVAEIGTSVGLEPEKILVARRRNNSAQQMRDFGRDPARESIIIWRKAL